MPLSLRVYRRIDAGPTESGEVSDHALVSRFKEGDEQAFNLLVRQNQGRIYGLALRMVGDADEAEDICQEVFVKAYSGLRKFREDSSVYTWLYRIALNQSVNFLRRKKIREAVSFDTIASWLPGKQAGPDRVLAREDVGIAVEKAVARLPARQRAVFVLRQYEGMSHEEIAQTLNRSVGAVKANYFHAVHRLQKELAEYRGFVEEGRL